MRLMLAAPPSLLCHASLDIPAVATQVGPAAYDPEPKAVRAAHTRSDVKFGHSK